MGEVGICLATLLPDPMRAGPDDLIAAAEAAAAAGATHLSVWGFQLPMLGDLDRFGLRLSVIEAVTSWTAGPAAAARAEAEATVAAGADRGATKVVTVCMEPALDEGAAGEGLAMVAEVAAAAGMQACVEFLPWSGIPDLATAWRLVEPIGPHAGILLDTWHWQRQPGGPVPQLLATIPGDRIGFVQLCDAAPGDGRSMEEAMAGRLLPGDGVVDFGEVATALQAIVADPVVATEVFNPALVSERGVTATAAAFLDRARTAFRPA